MDENDFVKSVVNDIYDVLNVIKYKNIDKLIIKIYKRICVYDRFNKDLDSVDYEICLNISCFERDIRNVILNALFDKYKGVKYDIFFEG